MIVPFDFLSAKFYAKFAKIIYWTGNLLAKTRRRRVFIFLATDYRSRRILFHADLKDFSRCLDDFFFKALADSAQ
ncbi:hypothetical protein ASE21_04930 [Flavobacterium sp. Root901]|nr:hypothetical protein ASE21_04930 [Flavobacterium sp. Root901]